MSVGRSYSPQKSEGSPACKLCGHILSNELVGMFFDAELGYLTYARTVDRNLHSGRSGIEGLEHMYWCVDTLFANHWLVYKVGSALLRIFMDRDEKKQINLVSQRIAILKKLKFPTFELALALTKVQGKF